MRCTVCVIDGIALKLAIAIEINDGRGCRLSEPANEIPLGEVHLSRVSVCLVEQPLRT